MSAGRQVRVGIYAHSIHVRPDMVNNVSGHSQLALRAAESIRDAGCDVTIYTTRSDPQSTALPIAYPDGIPLRLLPGSLGRRISLDGSAPVILMRPNNILQIVRLVRSVSMIARRDDLDVVHSFGSPKSAALVLLAARLRRRTVACATIFQEVRKRSDRAILSRLDTIFTSNEYTIQSFDPTWPARLTRHGVTKDLSHEGSKAKKHRVLFWREATEAAGADLVVEAFNQLAPSYPSVKFSFLLRASGAPEVPGLAELAQAHANVELSRFPYPRRVSLEAYLEQSVCVVLPFRKLSFNPQLAVLESIVAGVPTIASAVGSNVELWPTPDALLLHDLTVSTLVEAIRGCLDGDQSDLSERALRHAKWAADTWSWSRFGADTVDAYRDNLART